MTLFDEIDRVCCGFLWGHDAETMKILLTGCDNLQRPMGCGGLGIQPMRLMNMVGLFKLGLKLLNA